MKDEKKLKLIYELLGKTIRKIFQEKSENFSNFERKFLMRFEFLKD